MERRLFSSGSASDYVDEAILFLKAKANLWSLSSSRFFKLAPMGLILGEDHSSKPLCMLVREAQGRGEEPLPTVGQLIKA